MSNDLPSLDGASGLGALPIAPDPHGQAAILLVESLIHGLIARSVLTAAEAVEIVDIAGQARTDIGDDRGEAPHVTAESLSLLQAISASLMHDVIGRDPLAEDGRG